MPKYSFHLADGSRDRDIIGTELVSHREAKTEAIRFAGQVLYETPQVLWEHADFRVEVTKGSDMLLFTVIILAVDAPMVEDEV